MRDVDLNVVDFCGLGPSVLLIHGLCGTGMEWASTAEWLAKEHHVVSYDQRGHGKSTRQPSDVSHAALVRDAEHVIESLPLAPVTVIGQSLGARIAFLLAARRPDLVHSLVVVDGTPDKAPDVVESLRESLSAWPIPFESPDAAARYFGGEPLTARVWAESLEERDGGLWPQFDLDVMLSMLKDVGERDYWTEWRSIAQPVLVVGGSESKAVDAAVLQRMATEIPNSRYVSIPGAGHDVHLDRPERWREAVTEFMRQLP